MAVSSVLPVSFRQSHIALFFHQINRNASLNILWYMKDDQLVRTSLQIANIMGGRYTRDTSAVVVVPCTSCGSIIAMRLH